MTATTIFDHPVLSDRICLSPSLVLRDVIFRYVLSGSVHRGHHDIDDPLIIGVIYLIGQFEKSEGIDERSALK